MGVIISSAVLPATLALMWSGQNNIAMVASPILGLACSLIGWLVTAKTQYGTLSVATTGANNPMLVGNVVALLSPMIFIPLFTYAFGPQHYDWKSMLLIRLGDDSDIANSEHIDLELVPGRAIGLTDEEIEREQAQLKRSGKIAQSLTVIMTLILLVLWPMPMFGSGYVFSKGFFTGWVVVGMIWIFFAVGSVGIFPLWEGRHSMAHTFKAIYKELSGHGPPKKQHVMDGQDIGTPSEDEGVKGTKGKISEKSIE